MLYTQTKTQKLGFSFLSSYQAQKEVTVNENININININKIDLLLNRGVKSFTKNFEVSSLVYGDLVIVPADVEGDLASHKNEVVLYTDELQYIRPLKV